MRPDLKIYLGLLLALVLLFTLRCEGARPPIKKPPYSPTLEEPRPPAGRPKPVPVQKEKELFADQAGSVYVVPDHLNLRACAGLNCQVISVLQGGEELVRIAEEGEWMKVRVKTTDKEGWVSSKFVSSERPKAAPRPSKQATPTAKPEEEWAAPKKGTGTLPSPKEDFAR